MDSGTWRPFDPVDDDQGRRMSEMAPLDAGFDLSIRGFGQASGWSPSAARLHLAGA
jgi:hypothetical protein